VLSVTGVDSLVPSWLIAQLLTLTLSNALRTFYSFIYLPNFGTTRESCGREDFATLLVFNQGVAPVFGPHLFVPTVLIVRFVADHVRVLQSAHVGFYLSLIEPLLVVILGLTLP
jgi:hydrogenase-4 component B